MIGLDFRLLGPLEVHADGRPLPLGGTRPRTILAMLLLAGGRAVTTDDLVDAVWDGDPPATGRTQVSICVAALRKTLSARGGGPDLLVTARPGYRLVTTGHRVDAVEFTTLVAQARVAAGLRDTGRALALFRAAMSLWRGPAAGDLRSAAVRSMASRLDEEWRIAHEEYTDLRLELGQHGAVTAELAEVVRREPAWERARGQLMLAYYRAGRRGEALDVFRAGREWSIATLGLEPGTDLVNLHLAVLQDDPALAPPRTPAPMPPGTVRPAQLPAQAPVLVGRHRELAELDAALLRGLDRSSPMRWAQITGDAGVGKTALALRWAHRAEDWFPDGQLFADLGRAGGEVVLDDFLWALGRSRSQCPDGLQARVALYRSLLSHRRMLIVLDGASGAEQVRMLLPGSGTCRVVVTCRARLVGTPTAVLHLGPWQAESVPDDLTIGIGGSRRLG